MSNYNKFIVALVGLAVTYLTAHYGASNWVHDLVAALTALGVYTVPNKE